MLPEPGTLPNFRGTFGSSDSKWGLGERARRTELQSLGLCDFLERGISWKNPLLPL